MFNANNFSKRENLIINLMLEGVRLGRLSTLVDLGMEEIKSGLTTGEAVAEVLLKKFKVEPLFVSDDFSMTENVIIDCLLQKVNINNLFKLLEISVNKVECGATSFEAVRTAMFDLKISNNKMSKNV